MWSLEDETSLPSENERILAKETINALQKKKEDTLAKLEGFKQDGADKLEYEIFKMNAWLAPIRRVPTDVLSLIFIEVCRVDWAAPRELGLVCRLWRVVLLDTPRAWAFLQITPDSRAISSGTLVSLWVSRSSAFKHHISLPPFASEGVVDAVCRSGASIKCLSFFGYSYLLRKRFPHLEELRLGPPDRSWASFLGRNSGYPLLRIAEDERKENPSSILSIERFPKLVSLHLHSPHPMVMEAVAHNDCFPALCELHTHACGPHWPKIIRYCAQTLVTLAIEYTIHNEDERSREEAHAEVDLPRLQHLHYIFNDPDPDREPFLPLIRTPNIQSYHQCGGTASTVHPQASLATSISLDFVNTVQWSKFSCATHLQIYDLPNDIDNLLVELKERSCSWLTSVKCISSMESDSSYKLMAQLWMAERSDKTGRSIEFQYTDAKRGERYGRHSYCYTYCRCELPAEFGQWDYYQEESYHADENDDDE